MLEWCVYAILRSNAGLATFSRLEISVEKYDAAELSCSTHLVTSPCLLLTAFQLLELEVFV